MRGLPHLLANALLMTGALTAGIGPAAAAGPARPAALEWVRMPGAEGCIGPRELALEVERRLGRAVLVSAAQAEVAIEGRVEPAASGKGFRARITVSDERGRVLGVRDLETPQESCRALDEPLGLVLALLVDPDAAPARPPPAVTPAPPPPPAGPEPPRAWAPVLAPPVSSDAVRRPARWRARIDAGATFAGGVLPGAAVGLSVRGEIEAPHFLPIEIGGTVFRSAPLDVAGSRATFNLAYGLLALCPFSWESGGTRVLGCGGAEVGAIDGEGDGAPLLGVAGPMGAPGAVDGRQLVAQAVVEGRATQRIPRAGGLALSVGLGLMVPFKPAQFFDASPQMSPGPPQVVFRSAPVAGALDLGVGLAFP